MPVPSISRKSSGWEGFQRDGLVFSCENNPSLTCTAMSNVYLEINLLILLLARHVSKTHHRFPAH